MVYNVLWIIGWDAILRFMLAEINHMIWDVTSGTAGYDLYTVRYNWYIKWKFMSMLVLGDDDDDDVSHFYVKKCTYMQMDIPNPLLVRIMFY